MLVGGLCVLVGMVAMLLRRRSMYFRLLMLTNVVMVRCFKMMMGGRRMVCGSSMVVLTCSVLLFVRHLSQHLNLLLKNDPLRQGATAPI
jgi:hypothetical protein